MIEIEAFNTHLYRGARGKILGDGLARDGYLRIVFSDGVVVAGRLSGTLLILDAYVTAGGTSIPCKAWEVRYGDQGQITIDNPVAMRAP